jgi:glycosyltransferase involved in cell wall biosynthesis
VKTTKFDVSYLSVDSIQEGVGSSQITPLILGLAERGKSVCLVTFEKVKPSEALIEIFSRAGVVWIAKDFGRNGPIGGLIRLSTLRRSVPSSLVLHGRSDIATVAAILSRVNAPVLWDVRSLWSDQRLLIGSVGWNRFTVKAARALENLAARKSSAMTTLTAAVVPILEQRHKRIPTIREVIPTCVQTSKFLPSPMPRGQITCLLSGTFNNYYDIEKMKQVLEMVRESVNLKVIWARAGESPSWELGVGEDEIISATHSEMPKLVRESHFGIAICRQDSQESLAAAVPTKIGEFLASGRPVIVSNGIGDLDQMLVSTLTGVIVEEDSSLEVLAKQVTDLINDPMTPERCRELAMKHFDMETSIDRYLDVYERMLKK